MQSTYIHVEFQFSIRFRKVTIFEISNTSIAIFNFQKLKDSKFNILAESTAVPGTAGVAAGDVVLLFSLRAAAEFSEVCSI